MEEATGFVVYLPRPIESTGDQHLRVQMETTVYDAAGEVRAEAFDRLGDFIPQPVEPGDAGDEVSTNQLLMLSTNIGNLLGGVSVEPQAITPQGDGINDQVELSYNLFRVQAAQVEVAVYTLGGTKVREVRSGVQSAGVHTETWDGRDDQGDLLAPGIYFLLVEVDADEGHFSRLQPVAVAY